MKVVSQLLKEKGHKVWTIGPEASVFAALKFMAEKGIGALVVTEGGRLVGVFSERDYARKIVLQGRSSKTTSVADVMTRKVVVANPDNTVEECMALMTAKRIRHLPVVVDGRVDGIVSIGDLVRAIIEEQKFMIEQLENYIYGLPTAH